MPNDDSLSLSPDPWWQDWRWIASTAAVVAAVGLVLFGVSQWRTEQSRTRTNAEQECRSKVAAAMSSAQVNNDVAFNELVVALTDPTRRPFTPEIKKITDTGTALVIARDARVAFEEHPTGRC